MKWRAWTLFNRVRQTRPERSGTRLPPLWRRPSWLSLVAFWLHPNPDAWPAAVSALSAHSKQETRQKSRKRLLRLSSGHFQFQMRSFQTDCGASERSEAGPVSATGLYQDGFEVALEKVSERRQEVDGGTMDELPLCAADLLLCLATLHQRVAWNVYKSTDWPNRTQIIGD